MEGKKLADMAAKFAEDKKGQSVLVLDLKNANYVADYFVIASGDSYVQVKVMADYIEDELSKIGIRKYHREDDKGSTWILLDYGDVIVHLFEESTRQYYSLERLWGDKIKKTRSKDAGKPKRKSRKNYKRKPVKKRN
jgi:ribosome-associated protein